MPLVVVMLLLQSLHLGRQRHDLLVPPLDLGPGVIKLKTEKRGESNPLLMQPVMASSTSECAAINDVILSTWMSMKLIKDKFAELRGVIASNAGFREKVIEEDKAPMGAAI